jgi:hypothetical protein
MAATKTTEPLDMKLEVVVIGVSDVDRQPTATWRRKRRADRLAAAVVFANIKLWRCRIRFRRTKPQGYARCARTKFSTRNRRNVSTN